MLRFLFFIVVLLGLGYGYVGLRLIPPLPISSPWKAVLVTLVVFAVLLGPLAIYLEMQRQGYWADIVAWTSYIVFGLFCLLATFVLMRDVVWIALHWISSWGIADALPADSDRRQFLLNAWNAGAVALAVGGGALGLYRARRAIQIEAVQVVHKSILPALHGFRIAQISDLHVGPTIKRDFVEEIVRRTNDLNPDLIALTGDMVDGDVDHLREHVAPLARLKARHGVFFVTGNHEYYSGALPWMREMERLGATVLTNEHRILQHNGGRLLVGGVTDASGGRFIASHRSDPALALHGAGSHDFRLLLAHQPVSSFGAEKAGFHLQISGHTHGGQFFPGNILIHLFQPFVRGLAHLNEMLVYVNRGTGYWGPPLRLGADPEITLLELTSSDKS